MEVRLVELDGEDLMRALEILAHMVVDLSKKPELAKAVPANADILVDQIIMFMCEAKVRGELKADKAAADAAAAIDKAKGA